VPPEAKASASTQTERTPTTSRTTEAPPENTTRTYAGVAIQATPPTQRKGHPGAPQRTNRAPQGEQTAPIQRARRSPTTPETPLRPLGKTRQSPAAPTTKGRQPTTRASDLIMHEAPLQYKPGTMRGWIEENTGGVKMLGIRWLLKEDRRDMWRPPWSYT